jgi:calmodulin
VLRNLGIETTDKELQQIMLEADLDDNGTIDQSEFLNIMYNRITTPKEDLLSACFRGLDKDQSGSISTPELLHAMRCLGEKMTQEEALAMLHLGDVDRDGVISFQDFVSVMSYCMQATP